LEPTSLLHSTGDEKVDAVLEGVIGLYELLFPQRVAGYYLTGSLSDGTAMPGSDIDLFVLFRGSFPSEAEVERVDRAAALCGRLSPIELDITPLGEEIPWPLRAVSLKLGSRLIYGEDTRDRLPLPSMEAYVRHAMDVACRMLLRLRPGSECLVLPLQYPDPNGEFYGYDRPASPGAANNTKDLVTAVGLAATAILAFRAGRYTAGKRDAIRLYREVIDDEWADLAQQLYETCRNGWGYEVPAATEGRLRLRALCERVVGFENHLLEIRDEYLHPKPDPPGSRSAPPHHSGLNIDP
jgi:hypothetical protein